MENYKLDTFSVKNHRSFYKEQTLDLTHEQTTTAFFGANASGKTNLFKALTIFTLYVQQSTNPNISGVPYLPFLLNTHSNNEPSVFTVVFHNSKNKYKYSFSLQKDQVLEEEMYDLTSSRPRTIFKRSEGPSETFARNGFGKKLFEGPESAREDSLLITLAQRTRNPYANAVFNLVNNITTITLTDTYSITNYVANLLEKDPSLNKEVTILLKEADFAIENFAYNISKITPETVSGMPFSAEIKEQLIQTGQNISISTVHTVRDDNGDSINTVLFDMNMQESLGTRVFFNLIVTVLDVIAHGKTLYIDEFGSSLHTNICQFIIKLFERKGISTGARLIINTHDTGLIKNGTYGILDKDNISIVEKDRFEQSIITPLREKMNRSDENISKKYIMGLYGGVPILEEIE